MATKFLEPGGDSTFIVDTTTNGGFWDVISSATIATDFVHGTHIKSIKCASGAGQISKNGILQAAGNRFSFYIYIVTLPITTVRIFEINSNAAGRVFKIKLKSTGAIVVTQDNNTQLGGDGPILSTARWYRLSIAYTVTDSTHNEFRLWVDGNLFLNLSNQTITYNVSFPPYQLGIGNFDSDANLDFRSSDIYVDDSSSLIDTGDVWVTAKRPFINGTLNEWTTQIGSGGSGYGSGHSPQVNERALSTTNGWSFQDTVKRTEEYTIESAGAGDIAIPPYYSIVDYMGWVYAKVGSASTGNIIVGGTATNISVTTSYSMFTKAAGSTTYPAGNTDIGMDTNTVNQLFSLAECGIMVAFIPQGTALGNDQTHFYRKQGFQ